MEKSKKQTFVYQGFLLGGLSCMIASLGTHPIDTIKVRLQLQGELCLETKTKYNGMIKGKQNEMIKGVQTIIREEGIIGLYKGITASLVREATYSTVRMGLYEPFKNALKGEKETLGIKIISGGLSGAVGSAFATPSDLIKIRMQASSSYSHSTAWHAFKDIIKNQGIKGLYRGVVPTTQRAVILTATQLPSYDHSKHLLLNSNYFKEGIFTHCICSMFSGLLCATTTSPIDVVKSRYMNQVFEKGKGIKYQSTLDCFVKCIQSEGIKGLYKGWFPNWMRLGPHTIITFVVLEQLRRLSGMSPV